MSLRARRSRASTISSSVRSRTAASRAALVGLVSGLAGIGSSTVGRRDGPTAWCRKDSRNRPLAQSEPEPAAGSAGEPGAERLDVGAVLGHAPGRLADGRHAGGGDHLGDRLDADLAVPQVLVPVAARAGGVLGIVGVHQVDAPGDRLDPVDDARQVSARILREGMRMRLFPEARLMVYGA